MSHFAESLKSRRHALNMTMQAVADKALVSKSMICKIERDEVQPTLDVACRIARAVDMTLSEMLHAPQTQSVVFLPKQQQAIWEDLNHIKRRNISPVFAGLKLEWLHVELPAHTSSQKCLAMSVPGVEKYVLVVEGVLKVTVNDAEFIVEKGDSIYFEVGCAHQFANESDSCVEFYMVTNYNQ